MCDVLFLVVFCVHPVFLISHRMAKCPVSDTSEAQRLSPQSDAGHAPQLSGFKLTHGLFFSFYSFLEMPELFPMGKHAKAQYPENSSTPSEGKSIPILCLQRSQSMSEGEHLSNAIRLLPGSWGCSQASVASPGTPIPTVSCQGPRGCVLAQPGTLSPCLSHVVHVPV